MSLDLHAVGPWVKTHKPIVAVGGVALVLTILYARHRAAQANAAASDAGATTDSGASDASYTIPESTTAGYYDDSTTQAAINGLTTSINQLDPTIKQLSTSVGKNTNSEQTNTRATRTNTKATRTGTKATKTNTKATRRNTKAENRETSGQGHHPKKHPGKKKTGAHLPTTRRRPGVKSHLEGAKTAGSLKAA